MFARVTHYKMKPERLADATAMLETLKPRILSMPGMVQFMNMHDDSGQGYVVSVMESQQISDANSAAVSALWAEFADFLEEMPTPQGFDVIADWTP